MTETTSTEVYVDTARAFRSAVFDDRPDVVRAFLHDDVFWAIAGSTEISGFHRGPAAVVDVFRRMRELTGGTFRPAGTDTADYLVGGDHIAILDRYVATRPGRSLDSHEAWVVHLADGRVSECFHYFSDQAAFDAFWSPAGA